MSATLLINARSYETRVALLENGHCVEVYTERHKHGSLAGNIYLGRVARVLPGMQAAFVDIGLPKAAFLYVGDVRPDVSFDEYLAPGAYPDEPEDVAQGGVAAEQGQVRIEQMLQQGQELMVQVAKEPLGSKGARITTHITLPGHNLVLMPTLNHIGVSRRIADEDERNRLRQIIEQMAPGGYGFIARTASENQEPDKLRAEMDFLVSLWESILLRRGRAMVPNMLHRDLSVSLRAVRDLCTREVDHMIIDCEQEYYEVVEFVSTFLPRLVPCVEFYRGREPIFDAYGVEHELTRALGRKVWLKSGGYVVIEKTEALTTIDVNTGRYVGGHNLEETILKTNLEAVKEIACQIRLRDLGGLIVIDFIDMEKEANRLRVVESLKDALRGDRSKTNVLAMSPLGLVEMTRKRVRQSLGESLTEPCAYCHGSGKIKDASTVCYELFRELERELPHLEAAVVHVAVHPSVAEMMLQEERYVLEELESNYGVTIQVEADLTLHREHYAIRAE
ncbi:ribonuclease, Rne/Rng family [Desulfarculus baarsii DSM 2075]|uniref:Ribonuclease G n=1 Tax=Desulfarculus baarsii (strain ATCC 33931 / DSM 2075 / LMG 7858 / VKM B-1802 / 2st14) TaxID=644282 RepID=E1QL46_DESB2|nr:Rne/Rng family ribonuclease [Desulfarculus baarsii]ADK85311.1 ribonuclease, Rne/Rng family [Desulfarculus baarsii DSM 2075]